MTKLNSNKINELDDLIKSTKKPSKKVKKIKPKIILTGDEEKFLNDLKNSIPTDKEVYRQQEVNQFTKFVEHLRIDKNAKIFVTLYIERDKVTKEIIGDKPKIRGQNGSRQLTFYEVLNHKNTQTRSKEIGIGILVPKGLICLDTDTKEDTYYLNQIMESKGIKATFNYSYGTLRQHTFFKYDDDTLKTKAVDVYNMYGVKCDMALNGKMIIALPFMQREYGRSWGELNKVIECPKDLEPYPVDSNVTEKGKAIKEMRTDPEGVRNNTLFNHHNFLLSQNNKYTKGLSAKKLNKVTHKINILLTEPCDPTALENTLNSSEGYKNIPDRDKPLINGKEEKIPVHQQIGQILLKKNTMSLVDGFLYEYNNGYYTKTDISLLNADMRNIVLGMTTSNQFETIAFLKDLSPKRNIQDDNKYTICFKNKRINVKTMEVSDHDEKYMDIVQIPHDYNPKAKPSELLKDYLDFISYDDPDRLKLIYEVIGSCMVQSIINDSVLILLGFAGDTGKSLLIKIIRTIVGKGNYSIKTLKDLCTSKQAIVELQGKTANLCTDISMNTLQESELFKMAVSGEELSARELFKASFDMTPFATMVFSANKLPNNYDKTGGWTRRIIPLEFNRPFKKKNKNLLSDLSKEDFQFIINQGVYHVNNNIDKDSYTIPEKSKMLMEDYEIKNNDIDYFLKDKPHIVLDKHAVKELYEAYMEYADKFKMATFNIKIFESHFIDKYNFEIKVTTNKKDKRKVKRFVIPEYMKVQQAKKLNKLIKESIK